MDSPRKIPRGLELRDGKMLFKKAEYAGATADRLISDEMEPAPPPKLSGRAAHFARMDLVNAQVRMRKHVGRARRAWNQPRDRAVGVRGKR